jgi:ParB family chromosome partitioning protein
MEGAGTFVPLGRITRGLNPRRHFDEAKMQELIGSVKEKGVIQPILLRPVGNDFELIAGERRFRAAVAAELTEIPAMIRDVDDDEAEMLALMENIHRDDLSPMEEAESAAKFLARHNGDRAETATVLCWDSTKLNRRLGLMNLVPEVREALIQRDILLGHAEILAVCASEKQPDLLKAIIENKLSVTFVRDNLAKKATNLCEAIFDKGECSGCNANSTIQASLFETHIDGGKCTQPSCYNEKTNKKIEAIRTELSEEFQTARIIQLGEDGTYVKLTAEGNLSVGAVQAESCKMCADYGAAVSAIPGHEGNIERDLCFNISCHRKKVLAVKQAGKEAGSKGKGKGGGKKPEIAAASQKVKDYRRKIHNDALRTEIVSQPAKAGAFLLSLLLSGHQSYFQDSRLRDSFKEIVGEEFPLTTIGGKSETPYVDCKENMVLGLDMAHRNRLAIAAAASTVEKIPENEFPGIIKFFEVDITKYWRLNDASDFMSLLTKTEISAICTETGIDKKVKKFTALMGGKKEEAIKTCLNIPEFNYEGIIPAILTY